MNIFLSISELTESQLRRVDEITGDAIVHSRVNYSDDAPVEATFSNCEIVFGNVPASWLKQTSKLRWMQLESVGFDEYRTLNWSHLSQRITITNLAGFFSDQVAQTALAGILALYRGIDQLVELREQRRWKGDSLRSGLKNLAGAKVVLFGYGAINRRLENLLSAFECQIRCFGKDWAEEDLDEALRNADIVVSTVPETEATIGLFNQHRLSLLKPDALFVNCGRGSVVDELALVTALENRKLGGAVIDVTLNEPLPEDHPFWSVPRTILTQHTGGGSADEVDRKITVFADNLALYHSGKSLTNIVDFEKGY